MVQRTRHPGEIEGPDLGECPKDTISATAILATVEHSSRSLSAIVIDHNGVTPRLSLKQQCTLTALSIRLQPWSKPKAGETGIANIIE